MKNTIYLVFESGCGYGQSFNPFHKEADAKKHFEEVCMERAEFEEMTPENQKEVLDNQELQCDDGEVIKIVPLAVS